MGLFILIKSRSHLRRNRFLEKELLKEMCCKDVHGLQYL